MSSARRSKVTGVITLDRIEGTLVLTVRNVIKDRAVTVFLNMVDTRRLVRMLTSYGRRQQRRRKREGA